MDVIHLLPDQAPRRIELPREIPDCGILWVDLVRDDASRWPELVHQLTGITVHDQHIEDSFRANHPSFFDATTDYDMVIFQGLAPETDEHQLVSRSIAFFLFDRLIVTLHGPGSPSAKLVKERVVQGVGRRPSRPPSVMHLMLTAMVDRFLEIREGQRAGIDDIQNTLLDPHNPFGDWTSLMGYRQQAVRLQYICEDQTQAVTRWREQTRFELDEHLQIRLNDLLEHIRRVANHAEQLQHDCDAIIQLHFSAVAHRTNEVMRVLTVISAIFLPLTLVAGIFGMNFEYMPELRYRYSYFVVLAAMTALGGGLWIFFKRKRYI